MRHKLRFSFRQVTTVRIRRCGAGRGGFDQRDALGSELKYMQHIARQARIKSLRNFRFPCWRQAEANVIRLQAGTAHHLGTRHFSAQVARESVAANAHHVLGLPLFRYITKLPELEGKRLRVGVDVVYVGIDAGDKTSADGLGIASVGLPFLAHIAPIQKKSRGAILFNIAWTEDR